VPNVLCSHCSENVHVPDDLAQAHCVRCGNALVLETGFTAHAPTMAAEPYLEREPSNAPIELPEHYADFDEFRSLSPAIHRELLHMASRALPDLRGVTPLPVPEEAPDDVTRWGRPLGTLDVAPSSSQHWVILGWMLVCIGLLVASGSALVIRSALNPPPGKAARRLDKDGGPSYIVLLVLSVAAVGGGTFCLMGPAKRLPTMLWLFEEGVLLQHHSGLNVFRWDEILDFEIVSRRGGPVYWLRFTEAITVRVPVGCQLEMMPLMEYLEIRLSSSQFLSRLRKIFHGDRELFGILRLDRHGIDAARFSAPWSEIRRVITDAHKLYVDWSQRRDWVPFPYDGVSFPYLVVALASVLIDEHKRIRSEPEA
jgi:hypothetical protein